MKSKVCNLKAWIQKTQKFKLVMCYKAETDLGLDRIK